MHDDSTIQVDLAAITHNMGIFATLVAPGAAICGVIKADAYGLGAVHIAPTLWESSCMLAVFRVEEAIEVLQVVPDARILVLGPVRGLHAVHPLAAPLATGNVHLVVHDQRHAEELDVFAREQGLVLPVHLEVDTGLSRGGCLLEDTPAMITMLRHTPSLRLAGVMTHYSSAGIDGGETASQHRLFRAALAASEPLPEQCQIHVAATAGSLREAGSHHDMIRIGMGWCGVVPGVSSLADHLPTPLRPAVRWRSRIVQLRDVRAGLRVGYGGAWTARRDSRIANVPAGYADGVPVSAGAHDGDTSSRAMVAICGPDAGARVDAIGYAPIIGAVSMDQIAIDVTDVPGADRIRPGRTVELISMNSGSPTSLSELARRCGLTPHQVLTGISPRIGRQIIQRPETNAAPAALAV